MRSLKQSRQRRLLGRVTKETKGPPGVFMETSGQWDKHGLGG